MKLDLTSLRAVYASGQSPESVIEYVYQQIETTGVRPTWISLVPREQALARAAALSPADPAKLPLYGVPFAVKDNIDVAGMATTAGCPAYSYQPSASATVVKLLEAAGAILIGKTNLDQFATGLVGVRSPYGACASVFDGRYIAGGSSAGSAVAVAKGLVSFSLGTDTAGSGRVPAAFNNLVGLKPTRGAISAAGVVPACRSLDCVSIFALTCDDAQRVFTAACRFDASDPYSRPFTDAAAPWLGGSFRFGVPKPDQLEFFSDAAASALYQEATRALESLGGQRIEFDFAPLRAVADLLYSGPWVAERLAAIRSFFDSNPDALHPVVRGIVGGATRYNAVDTFLAQYRLEELKGEARAAWNQLDLLLLPTTGTTYTIAEIEADPVRLNTTLGFYTNFVNLLDLSAVAVPAGFRPSGLPFGVSLIAAAHTDRALLSVADRLHRFLGQHLGAVSTALSETEPILTAATPPGCTLVSVVGAHLSGQPLNHQLTSRGARLIERTKTSAAYRLYALDGTAPPKPGLVREPGFTGPGIEIEVWAVPTQQFGSFVAEIPPPLGIGNVELDDGSSVKGFICEPFAIEHAIEITHLGGWRAYLSSRRAE
ncbi:MAG: allophanate hydrolase [Bryobacteraceae bacterium]